MKRKLIRTEIQSLVLKRSKQGGGTYSISSMSELEIYFVSEILPLSIRFPKFLSDTVRKYILYIFSSYGLALLPDDLVNIIFKYIEEEIPCKIKRDKKPGMLNTSLYIMGQMITNVDAYLIANILSNEKTITALNLTDAKIDNLVIEAIVLGITYSTTIRFLNFDRNDIISNDALVISKYITTNKYVIYLSISYNNIGEEGIFGFANVLNQNQTLQTLKLNHNGITIKGADAIARALKTNTTLTTLDLQNNNICDKGMVLISNSLKVNSTLLNLYLRGNLITDVGAKLMGEVLHGNSTLTECDMRKNEITQGVAIDIITSLGWYLNTDDLDYFLPSTESKTPLKFDEIYYAGGADY